MSDSQGEGMRRSWIGRGAILWWLWMAASGSASALTDEEIFRDFRFNFVNPGARALGMGGAFIAAGDDATAAQSNPAALHYVNTKEVFLEFRAVRPDTQTFTPPPIGDLNNPNPFFLQLQSVNNGEDTDFPSFASFALPFRIGTRRARLALSRQVVLKVDSTLADEQSGKTTNLRFADSTFPIWINTGGLSCGSLGDLEQYSICNTVDGSLEGELVHYNVGLSYSFVDDFSIGLTATYATLDMRSRVRNTTEDPRGIIVTPNPRVVIGGVAAPIVTETSIDDSDADATYTVGIHWHPDRAFPSGYSPITFGLVYRKGASLAVEEQRIDSAGSTEKFQNTLREPDRVGFGASYRTPRHWVFAADVERIKYSDLLEGYRSGVNFFTSTDLQTSTSIVVSNLEFTVDDATVVHAGAEFRSRVRSGWGYAMRGGYYDAPDNRIRLSEVSSSDPAVTASFLEAFSGGENVDHFTGGFSLITPGGFQLQFAADVADSGNEYLASAIYRFGKIQ